MQPHNPRQSYNRLSRWYDSIAGSSEQPFRKHGLDLLNVHRGEKVLEIGCGTGSSLPVIAQASTPQGITLGLDISEGMLRKAHRQWHDEKPFYVVQADARNIPCADGHWDAIFLCFTLELFETEDIRLVLGNCHTLLNPTGRLCCVCMTEAEKLTWISRLYIWLHQRYPHWIDCRPIATVQLFNQNGFSIQQAQRLQMWGLPVDVVLAFPENK